MRVAVFTDADFNRADGLTTALAALLRHAPPDERPRIYTLSALDVAEPEFLALRSPAIPFVVGRYSSRMRSRVASLRFEMLGWMVCRAS